MRGRGVHSYTLLIALAAWIFGVYRAESVWWLVLFVVVALILQSQAAADRSSLSGFLRSSGSTLRYIAPIFVVYTLVTALFLPASGTTVWWMGPYLPMVGHMTLTEGGLLQALTGAFRLWALLLGMAALTRRITPDDVTVWLGKWFARAGLTLSMVITLIPMLQSERRRLSEYVLLRSGVTVGAGVTAEAGAKWRVRLRATGIVLQALLANGLERSWLLAESMHVRGYSAAGRTFFPRRGWGTFDTVFLIGVVAAVLVSVFVNPHGIASVLIVLLAVELGGRTRGTSIHY